MKKYALYLRVSTNHQVRAEGGSIQSQLQRVTEFLKFENPEASYAVYQEEGRSAKDTNRPEFQNLLKDIKENKVEAVVCTEISRISRSTLDFLHFIEFCHQNKVDFISLREKFDTSTPLGRAMMTIFIALAQFEREQISERTSANMQARAKQGFYNGGYVYGYRCDLKRKGHLYVDEHEASIVNQIFDQYLECGSYCEVAKWLNKQGYQTREYTSKRGKFHPAKNWCKTAIWQILRNPVYISQRKIKSQSELVNGLWPQIVPHSKWIRAQRMLNRNYETKSNNAAENQHHTYLFSRLIHCTHCGTYLESSAGTGNQGKNIYFYYRHPENSRKSDCPYPPYLPAEELENLICDKILELIEDDGTLNTIIEQVYGNLKSDTVEMQKEIAWLETKIQDIVNESSGLVKQLPNLSEVQVKELVGPRLEKILQEKKVLEEKKQKLFNELLKINEEIFTPEDIYDMIFPLASMFYQMEEKQKKEILEVLIEKVELTRMEMKIYVRVSKQRHLFEISEKFEQMPGWLPRKDLNLNRMIQSHVSCQLNDGAIHGAESRDRTCTGSGYPTRT